MHLETDTNTTDANDDSPLLTMGTMAEEIQALGVNLSIWPINGRFHILVQRMIPPLVFVHHEHEEMGLAISAAIAEARAEITGEAVEDLAIPVEPPSAADDVLTSG